MKFYPLADWLSPQDCKEMGIRAVSTGETRCPKQGEWYLSGAIVEAYRAPNDLPSPYAIARLVKIKTRLTKSPLTLRIKS